MSGPALRKVESHHAIHETAWHEADEALQLAGKVRASSDDTTFARVVEVFLEVVEARILVHAAEEEQGLYQEWLQDNDEHQSTIDSLILEHETLRRLSAAVEQAMIQQEYDTAVSGMSQLLEVAAAHSRHEENVLRGMSWAREDAL